MADGLHRKTYCMTRTTTGVQTFIDLLALEYTDTSFRKVLVVDDDRASLRLMSRVLESAGYEVRTADDGLEALDAVQHDCPHFIVTDWDMPNMGGIELCEAVRRMRLPREVYVVLVTARHQVRDMVRGIAAGANDFFAKPILPGELLARLQAGAKVLELERELAARQRSDPSTGLMNRRTFFEFFEHEWRLAEQTGLPLSCALIDLDRFKRVSDTYGYLAGDIFLEATSRLLKKCCRKGDFVCRYGTDEFALLLPCTDTPEAIRAADHFRRLIAEAPLHHGETNIPITASAGVVQRNDGVRNPDQLIDLATKALLLAKEQGGNRVVAIESAAHETSL
jgi:diguanylate cyclase (GGDEF)-like protein